MDTGLTSNSKNDKAEAFKKFRAKLVEEGYFNCRTGRVLAEMALFVAITLMGIAIVIQFELLVIDAIGILIVTIGSMGVSTNTHMWSHGAASRNKLLSQFMTHFGYPFFLQLSAVYWHNKHIVVHHPNPNVIGVDDDATLAPFFALTVEEVENLTGIRASIARYQGVLFPFAIVLNSFGVVITGWNYLIRQLIRTRGRDPMHWLDLGVLIIHYMAWMIVPCFFFNLSDVLWFTLVRYALISYGLFFLFAPAHYPAEAVRIEPEAKYADRVYAQAATTVNFSTGWFGRLLCAGVDYQIEHHLFPTICHTRYKELSPLLKEFFEQHGYPYRTLGWVEAILKSANIVASPSSTLAELPQDSNKLLAESRSRFRSNQH